MKRPPLSLTLGLLCAAAVYAAPARSGEEMPPLQPGLEIFDSAVDPAPAPGPAADAGQAPREADRVDLFSDPLLDGPVAQPPYRAPEVGRRAMSPVPRTPPPAPEGEQPADPYAGQVMDPYADPFAGLDENAPAPAPAPGFDVGYGEAPSYVPQPAYDEFADPGMPVGPGMTDGQVMVQAPLQDVLFNMNTSNPNFPGLRDATSTNDLPLAGNIIWDTLRRRRIVDSTMARGVRGSIGVSTPYDMQRLHDVLSQNPEGYEDPLASAQRINAILDSFQQPLIDDAGFGGLMPPILESLNRDIQQVRYNLRTVIDDAVFLELSRTYVRAATTCDFFVFPRRDLSTDVKMMVDRASGMFYPDGSSRGGDVAGVSGNLFQLMLMIEHYTRDDSWFRRGIGGLWRQLEKPARYVLDVACPDFSLPHFGPRGSRELLPEEVTQLANTFPPEPAKITRMGLALSESHPNRSTDHNYGGVYAMRDAKRADGRYLAVRFGGRSDLYGVPTHEDFGSLTLMTRGGKYLVDAGGYGGNAAAAPAHGGLSLNGHFTTSDTYSPPGEPSDALWRTNASIDYATDMAGFADGKTWQRSVVYVKNLPGETLTDYWMILDNVEMKGDPAPQTARIRYQLASGVAAYQDGPGIVATAGMAGTGIRMFAVDAGAAIQTTDGTWGDAPGQLYDAAGASYPAPSISVTRQLTGDSTTTTLIYPMDNFQHRPVRIERDSDIIRGRTGAIVIDHGLERIDVVAWAAPGTELVTPTLNLQLNADLAVFRIRRGKIARIDFINLERFQAKEPDGGLWSMRVNGPAQTLTLEPERGGGWQVMADSANKGAASFFDVNFGPVVQRQKFSIRPGEIRVLSR